MVSASSAENAGLRLDGHAASIASQKNAPSITEEAMANAHKDDHDIYIDVHILTGVGTDADSGAGGARSVETGAEFDYLPEDCSGAGIEDETVAV